MTEWLTREVAERYHETLVQHILGPFARALVEWAAIRPGEWALDVGCGTGAAARVAADKVGHYGRVVGVDDSAAMLEAARALPQPPKPIEWQDGNAGELPLPGRIFDVVFFAHTLQFLSDRSGALVEARRVLRPGGRVVLSAWAGISESPYYEALINALTARLGTPSIDYLQRAFELSNRNSLDNLLRDARFQNILITINRIDFHLPNLKEFIPRHLDATPIGADFRSAGPNTRDAIVDEVIRKLSGLLQETNGWLPFQAYFVRAQKLR